MLSIICKRLVTALIVFTLITDVSATQLKKQSYEQLSRHYGFAEMEIIKLEQNIQNLLSDDFNNDGLNDIAVANNYKSRIDILLQNPTGESSTSQYVEINDQDRDINIIAENSAYENAHVYVNAKMYNLNTGDFNSDGLADFVFYGEPAGLYIIYQKKNRTDPNSVFLQFDDPLKIRIDDGLNYSNTLSVDDINSDGKDDIILGGQKGVYIIVQTDQNKSGTPKMYPTTNDLLWLKSHDLNTDGNTDLVMVTNESENNLNVRLGDGNGMFGPVDQFTIERPIGLDFYYDKILTIERKSGRLSGYKYNTNDTKGLGQSFDLTVFPLADSDKTDSRDIATGDFNGDRLEDIVISFPGSAQIQYYMQSSEGKLIGPKSFPVYSEISSIHSSDIDNDKTDELIILSRSEKTVGISRYEDQRFQFPTNVALPGEPIAISPSEIDKDKIVDLFYIYRDANDVRRLDVVYNFGTKKEKITNLGLELEDLQSNPQGIMAVDVDKNGLVDLIIFISKYTSPILVLQESKGKFKVVSKAKSGISALENATMSSTNVADIDGDGRDELLIAYGGFARSVVLDENGWNVIDQYNRHDRSATIDSGVLYDIDKDKSKEILLFDGGKSQLQVLKADSDGTFRFDRLYDIGKWNLKKILPFELNDESVLLLFDGEKFALSNSNANSQLELLFSYESKIKDAKYARLAVGDLNKDGIIDASMVDYVKNNIEILTFNDSFQPAPAFRFKVFEDKSYQRSDSRPTVEPREIGIFDVTNDNFNDLVIIVHDRLIVYPQDK